MQFTDGIDAQLNTGAIHVDCKNVLNSLKCCYYKKINNYCIRIFPKFVLYCHLRGMQLRTPKRFGAVILGVNQRVSIVSS